MNHISKLKDFGVGKKCLIIGGGHSIGKINWSKVGDYYVICINNHLLQMANMIIYYDRNMQKHFKKNLIPDETMLVGFKNNSIDYTCERCNYYYNFTDMIFGDSGFHALQFADKIFNFKTTYLIGYDYEVRGDSYHYNELVSEPDKMKKFKTWSIGKVMNKYKDIVWNNEIFNCNKDSKLELFKYALPY